MHVYGGLTNYEKSLLAAWLFVMAAWLFVNMAAVCKSRLVLIFLFLNVCCCSLTNELLETVMRLLNDCARFYPHADLNMTENLIVRFEIAVDSVQHSVDSFDRGAQANAGRILPLDSLVRQLQYLLNRLEMLAVS